MKREKINNTLGVWGWINRNVQEIHTTNKENKTNYRGQKVVEEGKNHPYTTRPVCE